VVFVSFLSDLQDFLCASIGESFGLGSVFYWLHIVVGRPSSTATVTRIKKNAQLVQKSPNSSSSRPAHPKTRLAHPRMPLLNALLRWMTISGAAKSPNLRSKSPSNTPSRLSIVLSKDHMVNLQALAGREILKSACLTSTQIATPFPESS
jgi:hypothetical protein